MSKLLIKNFLLIVWVLSFALPFVLLTPFWAIISMALVFIGAFPIKIVALSITKPIFRENRKAIDLIDGATEAATYFAVSLLFNAPPKFLLVISIVYIVNQLNRVVRSATIDKDELNELIGFTVAILALGSLGYLLEI